MSEERLADIRRAMAVLANQSDYESCGERGAFADELLAEVDRLRSALAKERERLYREVADIRRIVQDTSLSDGQKLANILVATGKVLL